LIAHGTQNANIIATTSQGKTVSFLVDLINEAFLHRSFQAEIIVATANVIQRILSTDNVLCGQRSLR
jgi:hypothetical protein